MALEDEHGGTVSPEQAGRIAFYRGEHRNPYPASHPDYAAWRTGYASAVAREAEHRAKPPKGSA